jgi:hypothetical protein
VQVPSHPRQGGGRALGAGQYHLAGGSNPGGRDKPIDADFALDLISIGEEKESRTTIMVRRYDVLIHTYHDA